MDRPLPWLRYLDADDIDDQTVDFDGLKVRNAEMETLGKVEGFIVDSQSARPYYVVVDAGGWFKSKHYLLPVGHARIDDDNDALVVDLPKERIERFPGFDKDTFEKMSEDDIRRFNDDTLSATGATSTTSTTSTSAASSAALADAGSPSYASQWGLPQYAMPAWWSTGPVLSDRMGDAAFSSDVDYAPSKVVSTTPRPEPVKTYTADEVIAAPVEINTDGNTPVTLAETSDAPAAKRLSEDSPFFDGRAQPGDVLGLDTGGERTYIGETAEEENKRREAAEEAVRNRKDEA